MTKLIQLLGEGIEELWSIPETISNEEFQGIYKRYQDSSISSFEDYLTEMQLEGFERIFVEELYI